MKNKPVHTVPNSTRGGWDVKREGSERSSGHFETKAEAESKGRQIAINSKTEHVIHNQNGRIAEKNSYGNDPFPPKG